MEHDLYSGILDDMEMRLKELSSDYPHLSAEYLLPAPIHLEEPVRPSPAYADYKASTSSGKYGLKTLPDHRRSYTSIREIDLDDQFERIPSALEFVSVRSSLAHEGDLYGQWSVNLMRRIQDQFGFNMRSMKYLYSVLQSSTLPLDVPLLKGDITKELASRLEPGLIETLLGHTLCNVKSSIRSTSFETFSYDQDKSLQDILQGISQGQNPDFLVVDHSDFSKYSDRLSSDRSSTVDALSNQKIVIRSVIRLSEICHKMQFDSRQHRRRDRYHSSTPERKSDQEKCGHNSPHYRSVSPPPFGAASDQRPSQRSVVYDGEHSETFKNDIGSPAVSSDQHQRLQSSSPRPRSSASTSSSRSVSPEAPEVDEDILLLLKRVDEVRKRAKILQEQADLNTSAIPCLYPTSSFPLPKELPCTLPSKSSNLITLTPQRKSTNCDEIVPPFSVGYEIQNSLVVEPMLCDRTPVSACSKNLVSITSSVSSHDGTQMESTSTKENKVMLVEGSDSAGSNILAGNAGVCVEAEDQPNTLASVAACNTPPLGNTAIFKLKNDVEIKMNWIGSLRRTINRFSIGKGMFDFVGFFIECFHRMLDARRTELQYVAMLLDKVITKDNIRLTEPIYDSVSKIWGCELLVLQKCFRGCGCCQNSAILNALGLAFPEKVADLRDFARYQGFLGWKLARKQYKFVNGDKKYDAVRAKLWTRLNQVFFLHSTSTCYLKKDLSRVVYQKLKTVYRSTFGKLSIIYSTGPVCVDIRVKLNDVDLNVLSGTHLSLGGAFLTLLSSMFDVSHQMKFLDDLMLLLGAGSLARNGYNQLVTDFYYDLLWARTDFLAALAEIEGNLLDPSVRKLMSGSVGEECANVVECLVADDAFYYNLLGWILGQKLLKDSYQIKQFFKMWTIACNRCNRSIKMFRSFCQRASVAGPNLHALDLVVFIMRNFADPKIFISKVCQSSHASLIIECLLSEQSFGNEMGLWYCVSKVKDCVAIGPYTSLCARAMLGNYARPLAYENDKVTSITGLILDHLEFEERTAFIRSKCRGQEVSELAVIIRQYIVASNFEALLNVACRDILYAPAVANEVKSYCLFNEESWHIAYWKDLARVSCEMPDLGCPPATALVTFGRKGLLTPSKSSLPSVVVETISSEWKRIGVASTTAGKPGLIDKIAASPAKKRRQDTSVTEGTVPMWTSVAALASEDKDQITNPSVSDNQEMPRPDGPGTQDTSASVVTVPISTLVAALVSENKDQITNPSISDNQQIPQIDGPPGKSSESSLLDARHRRLNSLLKLMAQQKVNGPVHELMVSTPGWMERLRLAIQDEELSPLLEEAISCKDNASIVACLFAKGWKRLQPPGKATEPERLTESFKLSKLSIAILNADADIGWKDTPLLEYGLENKEQTRQKCSSVEIMPESHTVEPAEATKSSNPSGLPSADSDENQKLNNIVKFIAQQKIKGPIHQLVVSTPGWMKLLRLAIQDEELGPVLKEAISCKDKASAVVCLFTKGWKRLQSPANTFPLKGSTKSSQQLNLSLAAVEADAVDSWKDAAVL